jgi:hypothetical protein
MTCNGQCQRLCGPALGRASSALSFIGYLDFQFVSWWSISKPWRLFLGSKSSGRSSILVILCVLPSASSTSIKRSVSAGGVTSGAFSTGLGTSLISSAVPPDASDSSPASPVPSIASVSGRLHHSSHHRLCRIYHHLLCYRQRPVALSVYRARRLS